MQRPNTDIAYVVISDLHLGEEDSLMTCIDPESIEADPFKPSPILERLVDCMRELLGHNSGPEKPVLILNGDALDLAFGTTSNALMSFERLLELVIAPGDELFSRIIYIPGNHDHHIWEIARETQFVNTILNQHHPDGIPAANHATPPSLAAAVPSYLLNQIIDHVIDRGEAQRQDMLGVIYPNLILRSEESRRTLIVHHGHYVEPLYHFISDLRRWIYPNRAMPETVDQLEAENFAWIDFVWSLLGRSGAAGTDVEHFFKMLRYPAHVDRVFGSVAERLALAKDIPLIPGDWLEKQAVSGALSWLGRRMAGDRCNCDTPFGKEIRHGLSDYLFGPTYQQLRSEFGEVPQDLSFTFGHTHKPFGSEIVDPQSGQAIAIYNSGGWTVDSSSSRTVAGAALLLASATLEVASIRIYDEPDDQAKVAAAYLEDPIVAAIESEPTGFHEEIGRRMSAGTASGPSRWAALARSIEDGIRARRELHRMQWEAPE
jgi:hypothetical protein